MVYKTCSSEKLIAQFYRDYKPSNSGWLLDAIEWIADAIEIIGSQGLTEQFKDLEIIDYRVKLPCEADVLLGISYKGFRLPRNGGIRHKDPSPTCCLNNLPRCIKNSYSLNPNYIQTSFQTGCIRVYYMGLELDCNGFPHLPDSAIYREAINWYILMKMIGRGFKHQTFSYKDADLKWTQTYPKAQNKCKQLDPDGMETFKKNWLGLARSITRSEEFFNTDSNNIIDNSHNPGDLLQTFQLLGPNANNP